MSQKYTYQKEKLPIPVIEGMDELVELYYKTWEIAFKNIDYINLPGWKNILTCMPGVGKTWLWDSCIMAFITNYSNGTLSALNNLDNFYMLQREDGYISMAYKIEDGEPAFGERINPPLLAWCEWRSYQVTGDKDRIARILPHLEGMFDFIEKNRKRGGTPLYWFEDAGSSGMDNSPRAGYAAWQLHGSDVCFVDLAAQQAMSAKYIALMHKTLGNIEKQTFYEAENKRICNLINTLHWSDKSRFYYDLFARSGPNEKPKYINTKTAAAFWTMLAGAARGRYLEGMVEHLFNEDEFYTKVPFASLSRDDLNYDKTGGYWLGGVWPPTNLAAIEGLCEAGRTELARDAAFRYLKAICEVDKDPVYGGIWECYAPEAYKPSTREEGILVKCDFVGWGGLAPITMLIENIIGLTFSADENTVNFNLSPSRRVGLCNMLFNGGMVSVVCKEYSSFKNETVIETEAEKPFLLRVITKNYPEGYVADIPVGRYELKL